MKNTASGYVASFLDSAAATEHARSGPPHLTQESRAVQYEW